MNLSNAKKQLESIYPYLDVLKNTDTQVLICEAIANDYFTGLQKEAIKQKTTNEINC